MGGVRVLTWNIRHGGGRQRLQQVIDTVCRHGPDIFVLTEYRTHPNLDLSVWLAAAGWPHQVSSHPAPRTNGILIGCRRPLEPLPRHAGAPMLAERWQEVFIPSHGVGLTAVHIPNYRDNVKKPDPERWDKETFWRGLLTVARDRIGRDHVIIGDFNTGKNPIDTEGAPFHCSSFIDELESLGWGDGWRSLHPDERDFTWYGRTGNGFRIDRGYVTPGLRSRLRSAWHSHAERVASISDHAALILEFADE